MKNLSRIIFGVCLIFATQMAFSQSTYGLITPVGGVTANVNQEITFTYPAVTGASYYWSAYPSSSKIALSNVQFTTAVTSNTVKIKFAKAMVAFVCVTRYKAGAQPSQECISFNVVSCTAPSAPTSITGPATVEICSSNTFSTTAITGATSYQWSGLASGDKITTTPSITLSNGDLTVGSNVISVKALNSCGGASSDVQKSVDATDIAAPTSITGPSIVTTCSSSVTYSTNSISGAVNYVWSGFKTGDKITSSPSVTVAPSDLNSSNSTLSVKAQNACGGFSSASTPFNVSLQTSTASITTSGSTSFCAGGSVTLTANSGSGYLWSNGATTQSVTVSTAGNYSVTVTDVNGCALVSAPVAVTIISATVPTITASGPTTFCPGGSVTLTSSSGNSYLWSNGATTQSITVGSAGNYSVTVTSGNNCQATSSPVSVSVSAPAAPTISFTSGNNNVCSGPVSLASSTTGKSYTWSGPQGPYPNTQSINVTSPGQYSVSVTDLNNCTATSAPVSVTASMPVFSITGAVNTSICSGTLNVNPVSSYYNYLWNTGDTGTSTDVFASFTYRVDVTVPGISQCAANASRSITCSGIALRVGSSSQTDQGNSSGVSVYPNPSKNGFTVEFKNDTKSIQSVKLLDVKGNEIRSITTQESKVVFSDLVLTSGLYLIEVSNGKDRNVEKIIIE